MSNSKTLLVKEHTAGYGAGEYVREHTWKDRSFFVVLKQFSKNKTALAGLIIMFSLILISVLAPVLATYDYVQVNPLQANQTPSALHWFGTDSLGRDIFSRILWGGRYSLLIGVGAEVMGQVFVISLGSCAGYFGGKVDNIIMRVCDVFQSIPGELMCICVSQALGAGFIPTMAALAITGVPGGVRLLRATILNVRDQQFVEAAQAIGCSKIRIMFKHILPNSLAPLLVGISSGIGGKIMASAGLSFIGLGIQEPLPEWGAMIAAGKSFLRYYPHLVLIPGIFVAITVLCYNLIGDGLRDALDPKLRS